MQHFVRGDHAEPHVSHRITMMMVNASHILLFHNFDYVLFMLTPTCSGQTELVLEDLLQESIITTSKNTATIRWGSDDVI